VSDPGTFRSFLARSGRAIARWAWLVVLVNLLVTAVSIWPAFHAVRNTERDLVKVLSGGMPRAEAYKRIAQDFGITDRHFVLLEVTDPDDLPEAKRLADRLAELLAADPAMVRSARARLDLKQFLLDNIHLYLDEELASDLSSALSDDGLREAMERNREQVRLGLKDIVLADPVRLRELLPRLARRRTGETAAALDPEGFMVSPDRTSLLVDVRPAKSSGDQDFSRRLLAFTDSCIARARREVFAGESAGADCRVRAEVGGAYAAGQYMGRLIADGVGWSAISSFVMIVGIFALVYRRPAALLFIGLPLAVPVFWTLAIAPVPLYMFGYDGRMSIIGGAFCAVLLGLGVDYAIHIYNHFITERTSGASEESAAEAAMSRTGEGILIGALTTVVAFLGMTLTHFRGFREFGIMAGLGVLLTALALLITMPAALTLVSRLTRRKGAGPQPFGFALGTALRAVRARPGTIVTVFLLLTALGVAAMFADPSQLGVNFESDMGKMGPPRHLDKVGQVNARAARVFGLDFRQISVIVEADTASETLNRTAELRGRALASPLVKSVRDVTVLVPSPAQQARSIELARALPLAGLAGRVYAASEAAGLYRAPAYDRFIDAMAGVAASAAQGRTLDIEHLAEPQVADLASFMFRAPDAAGGRCRTHTMLSLHRYDGLESEDYAALARQIGADGRDVSMTSYVLLVYELKDSVEGDLIKVTLAVTLIVLVTLLISLRRPVFVLLALSPVLIGTVMLLTVMKATGKIMGACGSEQLLDLNYINVLVFPVLIGIGVDNAVHMIIRARQDNLDVTGAVTGTGRAMVLCSLTTILGFLSLCTCPHWGIRSLGIVVAIAMTGAMLTSVFFVPAVLELLRRRQARSAGGETP
jgi:hypothetical protein